MKVYSLGVARYSLPIRMADLTGFLEVIWYIHRTVEPGALLSNRRLMGHGPVSINKQSAVEQTTGHTNLVQFLGQRGHVKFS